MQNDKPAPSLHGQPGEDDRYGEPQPLPEPVQTGPTPSAPDLVASEPMPMKGPEPPLPEGETVDSSARKAADDMRAAHSAAQGDSALPETQSGDDGNAP